MSIRGGAEQTRDDELCLREHGTQHTHERDRASFSDVCVQKRLRGKDRNESKRENVQQCFLWKYNSEAFSTDFSSQSTNCGDSQPLAAFSASKVTLVP